MKMWPEHNMKLCAATHVIIVCAKFKVTARRFCLLDANALGGGCCDIKPMFYPLYYTGFTRVLPAVL